MTILKCLSSCILYFFCTHFTIAQELVGPIIPASPPLQCGFDPLQQLEKGKNSKYYQLQQQLEEQAYQYLSNKPKEESGAAKSTYTIPVVVHVVHNNGPENISDARIELGIERLNAAFANTGYYNQGTGVDTDIEFCLAQQDPEGNLTTGITNQTSTLTNLASQDDHALKSIIQWDPTCYINIYVVRTIVNQNTGQQIAGYAYLPAAHGASYDGIAIRSSVLSGTEAQVTTLAHEMGHYLGLYHTFEGGCTNNNCFTDGDRVCDTPPDQSTAYVPCSQNVNSCSTDTNSGFATDQFDDTQNYLDYQYRECRHDFTSGQRDRMTFFLTTVRQSLLNCSGCLDPCPIMDIDLSANPTNIGIGDNVVISASTSNVENINWYLNGQLISSGPTFNYQFLELGSYQLRAEGTNALPNCSFETSITLNVFCADPPIIDFAMDTLEATIGQPVEFPGEFQNISQAQWSVDGNVVSNSIDFDYFFNNYGYYHVELSGSSNFSECFDSDVVWVNVQCPVDASFQASHTSSLVGDTVVFTANNLDALTYEWYIEGNYAGDGPILSIPFSNEGIYAIALQVEGQECEGQSEFQYLNVDDPCAYGVEQFRQLFQGFGNLEWISKNSQNEYGILLTYGFLLLNEDREVIWARRFPSGFLLWTATELPGTNDYVLVGTTNSQKEVFIARLSHDGELIWSNKIVESGPDFVFVSIRIIPDEDEHVVLSAKSYSDVGNDSGQNIDASWLAKIGPDGTPVWKKAYTGQNIDAIAPSADNGYYAFGGINQGSYWFGLTKLDEFGEVVWSKGYRWENSLGYRYNQNIRILNLGDNSYVLAVAFKPLPSEENLHVNLIKVNSIGEILWRKKIVDQEISSDQHIHSLNLASNGDILFTAGNPVYETDFDSFGARMNQNGEILWVIDDPNSRFRNVRQLSTGEIAFVGNNQVEPFRGYVSTVDETGAAGECPLNEVELEITSPSYNVSGEIFPTQIDYYSYVSIDNMSLVNNPFLNIDPICTSEGLTAYDAAISLKSLQSCGDSILVQGTVCNQGNLPILSTTLITFYPQNPTVQPTNSFFTHPLEVEVAPDSCRDITIKVPNIDTEAIYAMINDDASLPPVFDLRNDFPVTDDYECNFFNNLASINLSEMEFPEPPFLQPLPDTVLCMADSHYLEASEGFDEYLWQDGSTGRGYWANGPGTYTLTASTYCGDVRHDTIIISESTAPVLDLGPDRSTCQNQVLSLTAQTGFEQYQWYDGSIDPSVTTFEPGTYWVEVIDICGQIQTDTVTIQLDPGFSFDLGQNISICPGGSVDFSVDANYTSYQWYPGDGVACEDCPATTISPTATTQYTLVGTADDCFSSDTITITVNPTYFMEETATICEGESIDLFGQPEMEAGIYTGSFQTISGCDSTVQVTLEVLPMLFEEASVQICEGESTVIFENEETEAGIYTQVFAGSNGCDSTHTVQLEVLPNIQSFDTLQPCLGQTIEVFGETVDQPGDFEATFTGTNGCDSTHHITVIFVEEINTFEDQVICEGESIELFGQVVSESGMYQGNFVSQLGCDSIHHIQLSIQDTIVTNAANSICQGESLLVFGNEETEAGVYSAVFTASNGCDSTHYIELEVRSLSQSNITMEICEGESVSIFGNQETEAGLYTEVFTASNGCDSTAMVELMVYEALEVNQQVIATCPNLAIGSIELEPIAGEGPFHYNWAHTIENVNTLESLAQGPYQVTITDQNDCQLELSFFIEESPLPEFEIQITDVACFGEQTGRIQLISDSENLLVSLNAAPFAAQTLFEQLGEGTYDLVIREGDGCEANQTVIITSPEVYEITNIDINQPTCDGTDDGSIQVEITGGLGTPTFQWDNGEDGSTITGISSGIYGLTIEDENGCQIIEAITVEAVSTIDPNVQIGYGCGDGEVLVTAHPNGGVEPYEISWSTGDTGNILYGLHAGIYEVSITDGNNCTISETLEVDFVTPLAIEYTVQHVTCFGGADGAIDLMVTGGLPPYSFSWNNGQTVEDLANLPIGEYQIVVTSGACAEVKTLTVTQPPALQVDLMLDAAGTGLINAQVAISGGTPPYSVEWSDGTTGLTSEGLLIGSTNSVVVTDANGCSFEETFTAILTSVGNFDNANGLKLYPNPTSGSLTIEMDSDIAAPYNVKFYSAAGQVVFTLNRLTGRKNTIDLAFLPAGLYFVEIHSEAFQTVEKVVVAR